MNQATEPPKYPRTPYWPGSPSAEEDHRLAPEPENFVGQQIVITEKLDGSNVLLNRGEIYARSTSGGPAKGQPWLAMTRKHHAWKLAQSWCPHILLYGEDLYGVHSVEYGPMREEDTFRAFASISTGRNFDSFASTMKLADRLGVALVPVLFEGKMRSKAELQEFLDEQHQRESELGGEREGMVIRSANSFRADEFGLHVCKSVRKGHVQTDEHWTKHWRPCRIVGRVR